MENTMKPFGIEYFESVSLVDTHGSRRGTACTEPTFIFVEATHDFIVDSQPDSTF